MQNPPAFHIKSLLLHWLVCGLLGMILAPLGFHITLLGYFEQWHALAQAPINTVEMLYGGAGFGGDPDYVIVRTSGGESLGWDNSQQRWIPSVVREEQTIAPCDQFQVAFNPLARSPKNIVSCSAFHSIYIEGDYTALYAIDQQGTVWGWSNVFTAYALLLYPVFAVAGGILGALVGSAIWSIRRLHRMRLSGNTPTQPGRRLPENLIWLLAILPFICAGGITLWLAIKLSPPNRRPEPIYTSVASTLSVYETAEVAQYQTPPTTPDPSGPGYDFAAQCPSAEWSSKGGTWNCAESRLPRQASVSVVDSTEAGQDWTGRALRAYLPPEERWLSGRYPLWEIHPGDHFRATLVCPAENMNCNLIFGLRFEQEDGYTDLGYWRLSDEQRSLDIDMNLGEFAGKSVVFILSTENDTLDKESQIALWVNPRIEQVP